MEKENWEDTNATDINRKQREKTVKNADFENLKNYEDFCAQKKGYKNDSERKKQQKWDNGVQLPMSENESCPCYLGVHIGENIADPILTEIFGGIEKRMPNNYSGYERIVKGGYKVDIKTATMTVVDNEYLWPFQIRYNDMADYFLLLAFGNRKDKNLIHIWLIKRNEMIKKRGYKKEEFYKRISIKIYNRPEYLSLFQKYEYIDKLLCINEINDILKD
jgi:hypothetical protein